jgi:hypothetical protein
MATEAPAGSGTATMEKIFIKTGMKSFNNMKHRVFQSAGVPGGSKMGKGDLCWDYTNEDAYTCTVAATTVVKINA